MLFPQREARVPHPLSPHDVSTLISRVAPCLDTRIIGLEGFGVSEAVILLLLPLKGRKKVYTTRSQA